MQCYKQDAQRRATITSRYRQALLQEVSSPVRWRHPGEPQQHMAAGDLEIADCKLAASQFMMSCQASLFLPFVFQASPAPSAKRITHVVESATRMFLAAYGVKSKRV